MPDYPNNRSDWIWSQIHFCNGNVCNGRNGRVTDKIGIITKRPLDIVLEQNLTLILMVTSDFAHSIGVIPFFGGNAICSVEGRLRSLKRGSNRYIT